MNTQEAESETMVAVIEYAPRPEEIETTCLAYQASWTDEQREAARYGLPRASSPIALASPMAQRRLAAGRVWHAARRERLRHARPVVVEAEQNIRHHPDVASHLKWEARFNREVRLPDGRRCYFGRRKAFATREEAVAWRMAWIERWERQGGFDGARKYEETANVEQRHGG
jgi:hypothetical protein